MYKIRGADGKEYGPANTEQMRAWLAESRINGNTLVQVEGTATWQPLSSLPEFADTAGTAPAPAAAPVAASSAPVDTRAVALGKVQGPAIALLVVGILCVLLSLVGLVMNVVGAGHRTMTSTGSPEIDRILQVSQSGALGVVQGLIGMAVSGFLVFSSLKMKRLEGYGLAMGASIMAMIPCVSPCCVLGLPFGIWALVVLNQPDVKSSFS